MKPSKLRERQARLRAKNAGNQLGRVAHDDGVKVSHLKLGLRICLELGLSPEASARLVRKVLGVECCAQAVRAWRASAYQDDVELRTAFTS